MGQSAADLSQTNKGLSPKLDELALTNDERRLAHLEQVDGLDGLLLQPVHQVHHQDGDVAQAAAARPQVAAEEGGAARFRSGARHRGVEGE